MICTLLKRQLGFFCRSLLGFLDWSFASVMGCFFGCFRVRDDRHRLRTHLVSNSSISKQRDAVVSRNPLSSLFLSEENKDSPKKDLRNLAFEYPLNTKELKDEAKFLKSCGTIVETPAEIRKASKKLQVSPPYDRDSEPSKFHSWLPNTSIEKFQLDSHLDQPLTPVGLHEEWAKGSDSSDNTPGSFVTNTESSVQPCSSATDVPSRIKSVRFEYCMNASSPGSLSSYNFRRDADSPCNQSVSKPSPYPTPLKLSDEMQTPGTVFTTNLEHLPGGNPRIRSQYVSSILNPIHNVSQLKALKGEDCGSDRFSGEMIESIKHPENVTPLSEIVKETSRAKYRKVEASLSAWLKPPKSANDEDNENLGAVHNRYSFGGTPGDRPIIGMVAAHWNEKEPSRSPPKWWDGNGIPNSTNKYKEDQKVSWHATPFEERLEKALSEESFISQRKNFDVKPILSNEIEETDTAISRLQSSTPSNSVVSF